MKKVAKFLVAAQEAQNNQDWQECIDAAQKVLKNEPKVCTTYSTNNSPKNRENNSLIFSPRLKIFDSMATIKIVIVNYKEVLNPLKL